VSAAPSARRDHERINDIHSATERIMRYRSSGGDESEVVRDAVLNNLVIIGEAVGSLSPGIRDLELTVPWRAIKGLRNLLAHEYFQIEMPTIWKVVDVNLPLLRDAVTRLLADHT